MVLPYLKGFLYLLCSCYGEWFMVYSCSYWSIFAYLVYVLNNWYQSTFLGQIREYLFSLFVEFFLGKKNRAMHFRFIYEYLQAEFGETNWVFEFLSEKYPISKNKSVEMEFGK
jgi:hypothetical protein